MSRRHRAAGLLVAAAAVSMSLTSCGNDSSAEKKAEDGFSKAADLSTCKSAAKPATRPYGDGFPQSWPFPAKTVVFNAEDRGSSGTVVTGISSAPFPTILRFMNKDVVAAGFRIENGETEEHDAEAEWKGNGFHGRWAIRESAKCSGQTVIRVLSAAD